MPKLYELTDSYLAVQDLDVPAEAIADTLEALEGDIEDKAERLLAVVTNMGSDVDAIDAEIKRLQARKRAITNRQDSLRDYLRHNMQASGIHKISCPLFTITLTKPRPVAIVDDESLLPDRLVQVVTTRKVNKQKLLAELKKGPVDGASLGESQPGLLIR